MHMMCVCVFLTLLIDRPARVTATALMSCVESLPDGIFLDASLSSPASRRAASRAANRFFSLRLSLRGSLLEQGRGGVGIKNVMHRETLEMVRETQHIHNTQIITTHVHIHNT